MFIIEGHAATGARSLHFHIADVVVNDQSRCSNILDFLGKATIWGWVRRTHVPHACRTHVLRAPGADPGHPGGRVVGAIDQYVSTTSIIISRGPQLVRKAVLMQT